MRPVPIPEALVREGQVRKVIGAPPGHEDTVGAVEVLAEASESGPVIAIRMVIDHDDVDRIARGYRYLWLQVWGDHLHPFHVGLAHPENDPPHHHEPVPPPEAFRDAIYETAVRYKATRGLSESQEALLVEFCSMLVEDSVHYCPDRLVWPVCLCSTDPDQVPTRHFGDCPFRDQPL